MRDLTQDDRDLCDAFVEAIRDGSWPIDRLLRGIGKDYVDASERRREQKRLRRAAGIPHDSA